MKQQPLVYICGPYRAATEWQVEENIRNAERYALEVWRLGAAVICPHKNTAHFGGAEPDDTWLDGDLTMLERCDAVLVLPGHETSAGSRAEIAHAKLHRIPAFHLLRDLETWIKNREGRYVGLRFGSVVECVASLKMQAVSVFGATEAASISTRDKLRVLDNIDRTGLFAALIAIDTESTRSFMIGINELVQKLADKHVAEVRAK